MSKRYLTAEEVLGADDVEYREVESPELGGWLVLRSPTDAAIQAWARKLDPESKGYTPQGAIQARADLVSKCAVRHDNRSERLFRPDQVEALSRKNAKPITRLFKVIMEMAGIGEKDLQEAEANFPETPASDFDSE